MKNNKKSAAISFNENNKKSAAIKSKGILKLV